MKDKPRLTCAGASLKGAVSPALTALRSLTCFEDRTQERHRNFVIALHRRLSSSPSRLSLLSPLPLPVAWSMDVHRRHAPPGSSSFYLFSSANHILRACTRPITSTLIGTWVPQTFIRITSAVPTRAISGAVFFVSFNHGASSLTDAPHSTALKCRRHPSHRHFTFSLSLSLAFPAIAD